MQLLPVGSAAQASRRWVCWSFCCGPSKRTCVDTYGGVRKRAAKTVQLVEGTLIVAIDYRCADEGKFSRGKLGFIRLFQKRLDFYEGPSFSSSFLKYPHVYMWVSLDRYKKSSHLQRSFVLFLLFFVLRRKTFVLWKLVRIRSSSQKGERFRIWKVNLSSTR